MATECLAPILVFVALGAFQAYRTMRLGWERRLTRAHGLREASGALIGVVGGLDVRVEVHGSRTIATIGVPGLPAGLTLARDGPPEDPWRLRERAARFPSAWVGWLRAEVRAPLEAGDRALRDGALRETLPERHEPRDLHALLGVARQLAALAAQGDPLREMGASEPDPWVRARAMVEGGLPDGPVGREPIVRLVAGWLRQDVDAMRSAHLDGRLLGASSVDVLTGFGLRRASPTRLGALLEALGDPDLSAAEWEALADAARDSHDGAVQDALLALLEADDPVGHAPLAFRVATSSSRPGVEEAIAGWTERARDPLPGVLWLERHGTVASVPALLSLEGRWIDAERARRAREAIQARNGGERGGLAIVDVEGGHLAAAEPPGAGKLGRPDA